MVCTQFVKHAICLSAAVYGDVILCFVCSCGLQQKAGCPDKVVTIPTGVLCHARNMRGRVSEWERHLPEAVHLFSCTTAALINWELRGFGRVSGFQIQPKTAQEMGCDGVGDDEPISLPMCASSPLASRGIRILQDCKPLLVVPSGDVDFKLPFGKWENMVSECFLNVFKAVTYTDLFTTPEDLFLQINHTGKEPLMW